MTNEIVTRIVPLKARDLSKNYHTAAFFLKYMHDGSFQKHYEVPAIRLGQLASLFSQSYGFNVEKPTDMPGSVQYHVNVLRTAVAHM